jgi:hypothetical protein
MLLARRIAMSAIVVAAVLSFSTASRAGDFTFVVPVDFNNLADDVGAFNVTCSVWGSAEVAWGVSDRIAIPPGAHAYHGDVTVSTATTPGFDPATAARYKCYAKFLSRSDYRVVWFDVTSGSPRFPLQSGAPFYLDTGYQPLH